MTRFRHREPATFSLSFLDALACGFGAIVLLLVLIEIGEPIALETARQDLDARIAALEAELFRIRGETEILERDLTARREQLSTEEERIARLRGDLSLIRGEFAASQEFAEVSELIEGRLLAAQQELTEEMRRLRERETYRRPPEAPGGDIPVDSE